MLLPSTLKTCLLSKLLAPRCMEYLVIDRTLTILTASPGMTRLVECPEVVVLGNDVRQSFPELHGVEDQLVAILQQQQAIFALKGVDRSSDRASLYIDLFVIENQEQEGFEDKLIVLVEDATQRMLLEQSLVQRANEASLLLNTLSASRHYIDQIMSSMAEALLVTTATGSIKTCNQAAQSLFGYTEAELVGDSIARLTPAELQTQQDSPLLAAQTDWQQDVEVVCQTKTGATLTIAFSRSTLQTEMEAFRGFVYIGRNITARKHIEQRLEAEYAITRILTEADTLADATPNILQAIGENLQWDLGKLWSLNPSTNLLERVATWHLPSLRLPAELNQPLPLTIGMGLPGRVWASRAAIWVPDVAQDNTSQSAVTVQADLHAAIGFPILSGAEVLGVLTFFSHRMQPPDDALLKMMTAIGRQIGQFVKRKQAEICLQQQLQQTLLLKQITQEIRQSLDAQQIFQTTAMQLGQSFQVSRCLLRAHLTGAAAQILAVAEYVKPGYASVSHIEVPLVNNPYAAKVLSQDQAIATPDVMAEPLLATVRPMVQAMGLKSMLMVRTSYQGEINGVIVLHQCDRIRQWTNDEVELLEAVAAQVGIALAQAALLEQETRQREELTIKNFALERAMRRAETADRAKGEFLAMMSHEIRTPMNAVVGMTELLLNTALSPHQQDLLKTVRSSGDALLTIIDDILDFSKIESGKLELEQQPLSLRACLEASLDLLAPKAAEKGLELAYVIDPETPTHLVSDVTRLRQILVNLLSNAVKFTHAGEVSVSVLARKLQRHPSALVLSGIDQSYPANLPLYAIRIAVKDTGTGIASDRLDRLFQPFSQVDSSINRNYGGTGLGLVISQRLCELMDGRIWVDSTVGEGSTFSFSIVAPAAIEPHLEPEAALVGELLLFDTNATSQQHLVYQAEAWGLTVHTPQSGQAVLSALQTGTPIDVLLLDARSLEALPEALVTAIRRTSVSQSIPLVLLTNRLTPDSQAWLPTTVLHKPVKQSQFYHLLLALLTQSLPVPISAPSSDRTMRLVPDLPLRILLAEDNRVNQKVALLLLQQLGYSADVVENGLAAIAALTQQPYDVVLMDVQMPEMDGLSAARYICDHWDATTRPRLIAMTANAMVGDREACLKAGMDDYISKPIHIEALATALHRCLAHTQPPVVAAAPCTDPSVDRAAEAAIDPQVLQTLYETMDESLEIMAELIDCYLMEAPKLMRSIHEAIFRQDAVALNQAAHTFKSSSAYLGATRFTNYCTQLEADSRAGILASVATMQQLDREYERVQTAHKHTLKTYA